MSLKRLRLGELLGLAGAICVIVSLFERSYEGPAGRLDAWNTFGPAVALLLAAVRSPSAVPHCRYPPRCGVCCSGRSV
jgi:hypothetical protein